MSDILADARASEIEQKRAVLFIRLRDEFAALQEAFYDVDNAAFNERLRIIHELSGALLISP